MNPLPQGLSNCDAMDATKKQPEQQLVLLTNTYIIGRIRMKTKLTISVERDLIAKAKKAARSHRTSLSQIVEEHFKDVTSGNDVPFSTRWRGRFEIKTDRSARMNYLLKHHQKSHP